MSYVPLIDLDDEFFGMSDVDPDQFQQPIDMENSFLDELFYSSKRMEHIECLNKKNYSGLYNIHNNNNDHNYINNNIECLNYTYGDRRESHYEKHGNEYIGQINESYNSPDWKQKYIPLGNTNMPGKPGVELFNAFIGLECQIDQNQSSGIASDIKSLPMALEFNNQKRKKNPDIPEFSYDGIKVDQKIVECKLINVAANPISESKLNLILSKLKKRKESEEERIFSVNRTRYSRANLVSLSILHPYVEYQYNTQFRIEKPYEPEYIRVQMNPVNKIPFNETRSGLCLYCPDLVFKNLKTSTYAQHLSLTHGIQTDNYITPNPLLYGSYNLKKGNTNRKTRAHISEKNGVICPVCHDIVETECSKTTATRKPLNNYLRHFREKHRRCKEKEDSMKFFSKSSTDMLHKFYL